MYVNIFFCETTRNPLDHWPHNILGIPGQLSGRRQLVKAAPQHYLVSFGHSPPLLSTKSLWARSTLFGPYQPWPTHQLSREGSAQIKGWGWPRQVNGHNFMLDAWRLIQQVHTLGHQFILGTWESSHFSQTSISRGGYFSCSEAAWLVYRLTSPFSSGLWIDRIISIPHIRLAFPYPWLVWLTDNMTPSTRCWLAFSPSCSICQMNKIMLSPCIWPGTLCSCYQ